MEGVRRGGGRAKGPFDEAVCLCVGRLDEEPNRDKLALAAPLDHSLLAAQGEQASPQATKKQAHPA
jgi:hypothetical protein